MKSLYKTLIINVDTAFEILIEFIAFYDHVHHIPLSYLHIQAYTAALQSVDTLEGLSKRDVSSTII